MKTMNVSEVTEYVKSRGITLPNGQVFITKPLYVFKKVYTYSNPDNKQFNLPDTEDLKEQAQEFLKFNGQDWWDPAIANLLIPKGSIVGLPDLSYEYSTYHDKKKFRSSQALCWNIVRVYDEKEVRVAWSQYNPKFLYFPCKDYMNKSLFKELRHYPSENMMSEYIDLLLKPEHFFDMTDSVCSYGVHFFIEPHDALDF